MATHSSVLAWRIPGTREPGGLPPMGHTESDTTKVMQQQQHAVSHCNNCHNLCNRSTISLANQQSFAVVNNTVVNITGVKPLCPFVRLVFSKII